VSVPASTLGDAIQLLGRQTGTSIGVRDVALARVRVRAVSGNYTAAEALAQMLRGCRARARRVAAGSFLIERGTFEDAPPAIARPAPVRTASIAGEAPPPPVEIVVEATKRDTPLSLYPGAITTVDGNDLSAGDATLGTDAVEARVAALTSTHLGPGRNKLFIRGIADSSFTGPTQATVGQYWGDTRVTYSAPDPNIRLYDVRSVEVLEGPQGTLYGAGSLGGIIRIEPEAPQLNSVESSAWGGIQFTQHGDPGGDLGGMINLPIKDDTLALRAVAYGGIDGGYIDDTRRNLDDVNRVRTVGGRASLRYAPGNDWTIDLSGLFQSIKGDDAQYADRDGDGLTRGSAIAQPFRNDYRMGELVIRKQWGDMQLVSSTGLVHQYVLETFDASTADTPKAFRQESRIDMFTSETRLVRRSENGSGWVIGASFLSNVARLNRELGVRAFATPQTGVRNRVDEATLYGEATIVPRTWMSITAGGRVTYSRLSGSAEDVPGYFAFRVEPQASASSDETRFLPSVALTFRPLDDLSIFARYQQGFRPGGLSLNRDYIQRFKGDRVGTAELGLRYGRGGDAPFDIAITGAYTDWRDIQADLIDGLGFPTTNNIGDGRIWSLGLAARWRPLPGLQLDGALYLNDSEVTAPSEALIQTIAKGPQSPVFAVGTPASAFRFDPSSSDLPNVAGANARLGFDYMTALGNRELRLRGYGRYMGESRLGVGPILGQRQGDYVDTGLEASISDHGKTLSLSLTNLLDTRGNRFALGSPFLVREADQITPLRPRTLRVGFELNF